MKKPRKGRLGEVVRTLKVGETIVIDETTVTAESVVGERVMLRVQPRDRRKPPKVYPLK